MSWIAWANIWSRILKTVLVRACYLLFNTGLLDESKRMSKIDSPVDTCREATKTEEGSFLNKEDSQTYTSGSVASPGTELHSAALN